MLAVGVVDLVAGVAPARAQAPGPGFQIDLRPSGRHIECSRSSAALRCLDYSKAVSPGRCDVGGEVPTVKLARRGRAQITFTCVDEGFHDWPRLRRGQIFRSGPFRCRASSTASRLRCVSTVSGWSFTLTAGGRIIRGR